MTNYANLIAAALEKLATAATKMENARREAGIPVPRYRRFEIVPGAAFWPAEGDKYYPTDIEVPGSPRSPTYALCHQAERRMVAEEIAEACGYQPRRILRAIRRIQAATAWCMARAEGCRRAGEEIVRQWHGSH